MRATTAFFSITAALVALSNPAWAQAVTLADLQGAVIQASVTYEIHARWKGREVWNHARDVRRITIGPGVNGRSESTRTVTNSRGTQTFPSQSTSFVVGQPKAVSNLGGGHILWAFDGGELTLLRIYGTGGFKVSFAFARVRGDLVCTIRASYPRETGAGNTEFESAAGGRFEIISATSTGSTCSVSKG